MNHEQTPDDSGRPWNGDELVFGGISCKSLARLCTCFISALRMSNGEIEKHGVKGVMNLVSTVLSQQLELVASPELTEEERNSVESNGAIAVQAICLAAIFSMNKVDPRHLAAIGVSTINIVHELAVKTGPIGEDDEVLIKIRKGAEEYGHDNIQMGVSLEPASDIAERIMGNNLAAQIKKIVDSQKNKLGDADPDRHGFGSN